MGSPSALRKLNDKAALHALSESGPLSRRGVEGAIGVSSPAAAELLRRLEAGGLVRRAGHRTGGPGPHAQLWAINERAAFAAGIDVSESGIDVVIADLSGKLLGIGQGKVGNGENPVVTVKALLTTAARRAGIRRSDLRQVVVGISGSIDPTTGMLSHADHIADWTGFDVQDRLANALGVPVSVENDVKLVLSDEAIRGRAVGSNEVLLLWMGTGIAIAVIADGRLQRGFHGSAGELSFVPLGPGGPLVGTFIDTTGVLALARAHGLTGASAVDVLEGVRTAQSGHDDEFLTAFANRVADVLVAPVAVIDPDLIILSGDIGTAGGDELADRVRHRLHAMLTHRPRVVPGTGHDNSVRQGALDEALRQLREDVFDDARDYQEASM